MTGFLLDTNIPSELMRDSPEPRVRDWFAAQTAEALMLSTISIGEIRKGLVLLPPGRRRSYLEMWLHTRLIASFHERILPVTLPIAERWGTITAERRLQGKPLNAPDGLIAATALEHGLTLVTRNVKDFVHLGVASFQSMGDVRFRSCL